MVHIKTKEGASLWIALLATAIVAVGMVIQHIEWWITLCTSVGVFLSLYTHLTLPTILLV